MKNMDIYNANVRNANTFIFIRKQIDCLFKKKIFFVETFITCGTISGTLLLILLVLDMTGLIPGVPGVHGAVEDRGPGERE
jgi:hypothetical protein